MTSKERMLLALNRERPDRVPVTVHQWQQYHLDTYMDGMDDLAAFKATGLDASIQYFEPHGEYWVSDPAGLICTPEWQEAITVEDANPQNRIVRHTITTPGGTLTYQTGANPATTWVLEHIIKQPGDIELIDRYMPVPRLDKNRIAAAYDRVGDAGILRGAVWGDQAGCWQHACCLIDVQELILKTFSDREWVHRLLGILLRKKLRFVEESLAGAKFDIIETGGGAGSDTVISPKLHREFCLPYDRRMHDALHAAGQRSTYHTCGGMMFLLDQILANGTDASETLSPPGMGGNITDPAQVRAAFGGKIAMIGGMDQFNILSNGTAEAITTEVHRLFDGFGRDGGYVMSASDHFFDTPPDNLRAFAAAARECIY